MSNIRQAGLEDCHILAALHAECFEKGWSADEFRRLLEGENMVGLLANDNEVRPAGFIVVRTAADEAEILAIGVTHRLRHNRIGAQLLTAAAAVAGLRGITTLFLEVGIANPAALSLYRRFGFAEVGRRRSYYGHGGHPAEDALILKAALPLLAAS